MNGSECVAVQMALMPVFVPLLPMHLLHWNIHGVDGRYIPDIPCENSLGAVRCYQDSRVKAAFSMRSNTANELNTSWLSGVAIWGCACSLHNPSSGYSCSMIVQSTPSQHNHMLTADHHMRHSFAITRSSTCFDTNTHTTVPQLLQPLIQCTTRA
jgi:hypothetical protein